MRPPQPLLTRFSNFSTAGVVLALAERRLAHQDVVELRERTQQLAALNRRAGHALALAGRQAEERVGHLVEERRRRATGTVIGTWLMLMTPSFEPPRFRSRPVAPTYSKPIAMLPRQLAGDVDRVLVNLRRVLVLIDELDRRCRRRSARRGCCRTAC